MFRYAVLISLLASPAWADVATLNGLPITALQTYDSFSDQMEAAGWNPVKENGSDEFDCNVARPTCNVTWQAPDGKRFHIEVDHRDDANEFYVRPNVWPAAPQ